MLLSDKLNQLSELRKKSPELNLILNIIFLILLVLGSLQIIPLR